ncbi:hypothetical protein L1F34_002223 [Mammaliicoccus lentus]
MISSLVVYLLTFILLSIVMLLINGLINTFSKGEKGSNFKSVLLQSFIIATCVFVYKEFISF